MLKVEVNRWLIKTLIAKWDVTDRVFQLGSLDQCRTTKEYYRLLGVHYNIEFIVAAPFNQGIKARTTKVLGIKKSVLDRGEEKNECEPKYSIKPVCQSRCLQ